MMNGSKIYIGNLPWSLTETQIRNLCTEFGEIADIHVSANKESTVYANGGFAFVTFAEAQSAKVAVDDLNEKVVSGRKLKCDFARPRKPLGTSRRDYAAGD